MRVKTWKVIDRGSVGDTARVVDFTCVCGREAQVPVSGLPIAQIGMGIVFDGPPYAMPAVIQCRKCR
ncbi:MAG TPA: hypothetical protein VNM48_00260, partial [Chloroflexota bacterium]|nr:hypothetical protein [Chloroflexota bacterium]